MSIKRDKIQIGSKKKKLFTMNISQYVKCEDFSRGKFNL